MGSYQNRRSWQRGIAQSKNQLRLQRQVTFFCAAAPARASRLVEPWCVRKRALEGKLAHGRFAIIEDLNEQIVFEGKTFRGNKTFRPYDSQKSTLLRRIEIIEAGKKSLCEVISSGKNYNRYETFSAR